LLLRRDRLFDDFLRSRSRRGDAALPALPELAELEGLLPTRTVYVAASLLDDELYLLAVRHGEGGRVFRAPGSAVPLREQMGSLRCCLDAQLGRYRRGLPVGKPERDELDGRLNELGRGPLGTALAQVLEAGRMPEERLVWVPDATLHGLPIHALRRCGRYLIQDHAVVFAFSGALFAHQVRAGRRSRRRIGPALVVAESPAVLQDATREGEGVATTFSRSCMLRGSQATKATIGRHLPHARAVHFACHAYFDVHHPLAAAIRLPSGDTWRALEWLDAPVDGLPLVTFSACRSAEVAPLVGREVFGLVTGALGGGVRAVLAGLWPVTDREALPLMWRFYRHRITCDLATALALGQREAIASAGSSPLFWAAFTLFGDADALPPPGRWWRRWARWCQRRHARRFPIPEPEPTALDDTHQ
jgi:hypothetical protein